MDALLQSLQQFLLAAWELLIALLGLLVEWPVVPALGAWIVFWLFAVNWFQLRKVMLSFGWIGVVLIGFVMVLVWGVIAPPETGFHHILGLKLSNFVGKTVYVTGLFCIMFLCGAVQLSGCCASCCAFGEEDAPEPTTPHAGH